MLWPDREGYALICPSGKHLLRNFQSWILCIILFSFLGSYNACGPGLEDRRVPGRWCPRWLRRTVDDRLVHKQLTGLVRLRLHDKIESSFHSGILIRFSRPVLIYRLLIRILLQLHCFLPEYLLQDLYLLLLLWRDQHAWVQLQRVRLPGGKT